MSNRYSIKILVESKQDFIDRSYDALLIELSNIEETISLENTYSTSAHIIEFDLQSDLELDSLHQKLQLISKLFLVDIVIVHWDERSVKPALLIMDMDSTLVQTETIDQIAAVADIGDKVSAITESAMRGELNFSESLFARVGMLKGITLDSLKQVHQQLPLTPGARQLISAAKNNHCYTALVSGGFTMFAAPIVEQLGIDHLVANTLELKDAQLTGEVIGNIVDDKAKRETLLTLKNKLAIHTNQIVAIGDGANDLLMLDEAGSGIAFHAKPKVQQQAKIIFNYSYLDGVNWLFGW